MPLSSTAGDLAGRRAPAPWGSAPAPWGSAPAPWGSAPSHDAGSDPPSAVPIRQQVPGTVRGGVHRLGDRDVVVVRSVSGHHRGALTRADGATIVRAAQLAHDMRLPLVLVLSSSGSDVSDGIDALHGWGEAAAAVSTCSGVVPVLAAVTGAAISGPALLLGLADLTVMTPKAFAYLSGPEAVQGFTGVRLGLHDLGGASVHATASGVCALTAADDDDDEVLDVIGAVLAYLPDHTDATPPMIASDDPLEREASDLRTLIPQAATASYDVRDIVRHVADDGEVLELWATWAPQLVTALASVGGMPIGVVANQPRALAGTLDIVASQKGARFVRFCDTFNLPIVTFVDTPGFLPGKDLEWRGMIRHGAELAFAYAEATVPRVCVVLRKAYGGAYIVMDSKGIGNDLCLAWPSAEIAVMGASGAVQILHRGVGAGEQRRLQESYAAQFLTPWMAAERGYVDDIVDPADTRLSIHRALQMLSTKREVVPGRKHDAGPL